VTTVPSTVDDSTGEAVIYQIGDAGEVTVMTDSSSLEIESVNPAAGWTVTSTDESNGRIQVRLASPVMVVTFTASIVRGVVVTSVESAAVETTPPPAVPAPATDDHNGDDQQHQQQKQTNTTVRRRSTSTTERRQSEDHEDHEDHENESEHGDDD
jgi:hypothetical protein